MPSSFSRFLGEEELEQVRNLYLESLHELEAEEAELAEGGAGREATGGDESSATSGG